MAGTTTTTTLNLNITAKDDASKIFEDFATKISETVAKIQEDLSKAFNMESAITQVDDGVTKITEALGRVKTAEDQMSSSDAATKISETMTAIEENVSKMTESVSKNFASVAEAASKMSTTMSHAASGINFGEMMNAGTILESYGKEAVGFFAEAIKAGAEFDQSIKGTTASLEANMGTTKLTTKQIQDMQQAALNFGSSGFFSANQVAEAMNTLGKQGLSYTTIMNGAIKTVYQVAAANQQDLEKTANVVADIYNEMGNEFKSMGLTTQQSAQIIGNSMTVALHHSKLSMDDFMASMKYAGPQASALGVSIQDVSAAISLLGQHGIKASQAGTTLRRMLTNLTPQSKAAASLMGQLGMVTKDGGNIFYTTSGKMKSLADVQQILHDKLSGLSPEMQQMAIKTIFGQYALSGMMAIVNSSPSAFTNLTNEMKNNGEMQQIIATKSAGLGMQLQQLNAHWQTMQKEIGLALEPVILKLVNSLNGLMDAWNKISPSMQKVIIDVTAIGAVLLTVGGAVLTFMGTIGMLVHSLSLVGVSLADVGMAFPEITAAIAIVVGVIAGLRYAWKEDIGGIHEYTSDFINWFNGIFATTFSKVKKNVDDGLKALTKGFTGWNLQVMTPINKTFGAIWQAASDGMKKLITVVSDALVAVTAWFDKMAPDFNKAIKNIMAILVALSPVWNALWTVLKVVIGLVFSWIADTIQHFWGVFSGIIQLITHIIDGDWKAAFQDLWQIIKNAFLLALDLFGGAEEKIFGFFAKIIEHTGIFGKAFKFLFGGMFKAIEAIVKASTKLVEGIFKTSVKIVETVLGAFSKAIISIFTAIGKFIGDHSEEIWTFAKTTWNKGVVGVKMFINDLMKAVQKVWSEIQKVVETSPTVKFLMEVWKSGVTFLQGLFDSYWHYVEKVFNSINKAVSTAVSAATKFLTETWKKGVDLVKGYFESWSGSTNSTFTTVKKTVSDITTGVTFIFHKAWETAVLSVTLIFKTLQADVKLIFTAIKDLISGHSDQAMSVLKKAFDIGSKTVQTILKLLWNFINTIFLGLPSKLLSIGKSIIDGLWSGINGGIGHVKSVINSVFTFLDNAFGGLPSKMLQWGKNGISMFVDGIKSGIGAVGNAVSGVANKIKDFLGMHSPARMGALGPGESDKWFPNMMAMFEKGINDNKDKVMKATMGVAMGVQQTFHGTQQNVQKIVNTGSNSTSAMRPTAAMNRGQQVININIDGRSKQTDKQLTDEIFKQFRTQMSMVMG